MADQFDPNGIGSGGMDPYVGQLIDRYRQYQLMQQIQGSQQSVGNPSNRGEGIAALGKGFMNMLTGFAAANQNRNMMAMNQAMAKQLGNAPASPSLPPLVLGNAGIPGMAPAGASSAPIGPVPPVSGVAGDLPGMQQPTQSVGSLSDTPNFLAGLKKAEGVPYGGLSSTGAIGAYGLTGGFIKDWGSQLGMPTDRASYTNNPALQDKLAAGAAEAMYKKYGNWGDVAQTWEAGGPHTQPAPGNTRPEKYRATVLSMMGNELGAPTPAPSTQLAMNVPAVTTGALGETRATPGGPQSAAGYGVVPPGTVAGPGAPSNIPMPIPRPPDVEPTTPEGRQAALTAPRTAPAPTIAIPGSTPSAANPGLSPIPMAPPQMEQLTPPGAVPGAAVAPPPAASPVTPLGTPPQAGIPPVAARPIPVPAPATGGSAYDPRTGRFLAPGEQIPGYAPAPQSSTGGGGLGGLLSSLFGGGTAQAAPANQGLASGLGGAPPPPPGAGQPRAPIYAPAGAQIPGYGVAPPGGAPVPTPAGVGAVGAPPAGGAPPPASSASGSTLIGPLAERYNALRAQHDQLNAQARQYDVMAQYAAGTPFAEGYQKQAQSLREQANQARTDANAAQADIIKFQEEAQTHARTLGEETWRAATPAEVAAHGGNPVDARFYTTNGKGDFKTTPDYVKQEFKQTGVDIMGNPKYEWVRPPGQGGAAAPAAAPGAATVPAAPGAAAPVAAIAPAEELPTPKEISALLDKGRAAGLKGEGLLRTLPPMIANHALAIAAGDEPMPDSGMAGSRPVNQSINDAVRAAFPGTSAQTFAIRADAKRDFAPGGKDQETILKLNSAVEHSANQLAAGHALGTGNSAYVNRAENAVAGAGSDRGVALADFNQVSGLAGPELQSIYTPTGGSGGERAEQAGSMNATQSPAQMEAVHKSRMEAVAARITALDDQYTKAMGPNAPPWQGLTSGALAEVQKYANDRLPDRLQARDETTGKPLAPASRENGFTYGQPQPAWATPYNRMVAPGTAPIPGTAAPSPGYGQGQINQFAQQHPYVTGAGLGIALGSSPAWAVPAAAMIGRGLLTPQGAIGAGLGVLGMGKYLGK